MGNHGIIIDLAGIKSEALIIHNSYKEDLENKSSEEVLSNFKLNFFGTLEEIELALNEKYKEKVPTDVAEIFDSVERRLMQLETMDPDSRFMIVKMANATAEIRALHHVLGL